MGYSWAGSMSRAVPYDIAAQRGRDAAVGGPLVRLSVGPEAVEDLVADCEQAFGAQRC